MICIKFLKNTTLLASLMVSLSACSSTQIQKFPITSGKIVLTGKIIDAHTRAPIPGGIKDGDTTVLAYANNNGVYRTELKPGTHKLRAVFIGYKLSKPYKLRVQSGDSIVLNFKIKYSNEGTVN